MFLQVKFLSVQVFEDAVELWMYYLKTRDELTRTTLLSPARWYTEKMLFAHVNEIRKRKLPEEAKDDEENEKCETLGPKGVSVLVVAPFCHSQFTFATAEL